MTAVDSPQITMMPRIGDEAPEFTAMTTQGPISTGSTRQATSSAQSNARQVFWFGVNLRGGSVLLRQRHIKPLCIKPLCVASLH